MAFPMALCEEENNTCSVCNFCRRKTLDTTHNKLPVSQRNVLLSLSLPERIKLHYVYDTSTLVAAALYAISLERDLTWEMCLNKNNTTTASVKLCHCLSYTELKKRFFISFFFFLVIPTYQKVVMKEGKPFFFAFFNLLFCSSLPK